MDKDGLEDLGRRILDSFRVLRLVFLPVVNDNRVERDAEDVRLDVCGTSLASSRASVDSTLAALSSTSALRVMKGKRRSGYDRGKNAPESGIAASRQWDGRHSDERLAHGDDLGAS